MTTTNTFLNLYFGSAWRYKALQKMPSSVTSIVRPFFQHGERAELCKPIVRRPYCPIPSWASPHASTSGLSKEITLGTLRVLANMVGSISAKRQREDGLKESSKNDNVQPEQDNVCM
jgi:hypothetical protein